MSKREFEVAEFRNWFRIRARWTVGEDHRAYEPVFVLGTEAAARAKAEMEDTLAHFPTLKVDVVPVPESEVPPGADTTPTQAVSAWIDSDLLEEDPGSE